MKLDQVIEHISGTLELPVDHVAGKINRHVKTNYKSSGDIVGTVDDWRVIDVGGGMLRVLRETNSHLRSGRQGTNGLGFLVGRRVMRALDEQAMMADGVNRSDLTAVMQYMRDRVELSLS